MNDIIMVSLQELINCVVNKSYCILQKNERDTTGYIPTHKSDPTCTGAVLLRHKKGQPLFTQEVKGRQSLYHIVAKVSATVILDISLDLKDQNSDMIIMTYISRPLH